MRNKFIGLIVALPLMSAFAFGQESGALVTAYSDRAFVSFKDNFESSADSGVTITPGGTAVRETYGGSQVYSVNQTGGNQYFDMSGFASPSDGVTDYVDVDCDVTAEAGVYDTLQLTLRGSMQIFGGTIANFGLFTLPSSATTQKVHVHFHRALAGFDWGQMLSVSIDRPWWIGSVLGGGSYDDNAKIRFDNLRITFPKRLAGLTRVTGEPNINIGTIKFSDDGTSLGAYTDWIQNIGNKELLSVYGGSNLGFDANSVSGSNILFRESGPSGSHQLVTERFAGSLSTIANTAWLGAGADLGGTDRYFGVRADEARQGQRYLFRQNVNNGEYRYFVRCLSSSYYYGSEVEVNLGGEELVAVGDFNGDNKDDYITRLNGRLWARYFVGNTGAEPSKGIQLTDPVQITNFGKPTCLDVTDMDGDGNDDLVMMDAQTNDVFVLFCKPGSATLKWIFSVSLDGSPESIFGVADSDNDGLPEVYSYRIRLSDNAFEVLTRKFNFNDISNTSMVSVNSIFALPTFNKVPCALGDINGDGSADVVTLRPDTWNTLEVYRVNPAAPGLLDANCNWICNAFAQNFRPIFK